MKTITCYQTKDGQIFDNQNKAKKYAENEYGTKLLGLTKKF